MYKKLKLTKLQIKINYKASNLVQNIKLYSKYSLCTTYMQTYVYTGRKWPSYEILKYFFSNNTLQRISVHASVINTIKKQYLLFKRLCCIFILGIIFVGQKLERIYQIFVRVLAIKHKYFLLTFYLSKIFSSIYYN